MIIDAHQHFWHYDPARLDWIAPNMDELKRDWLPEDLAPHLSAAGVDRTIAVQATGDEAETAFLLEQAASHDWISGVVGWVDLTAPDTEERIAHWQQMGSLVGLRHQLEDDPERLHDKQFDAGVAVAQRRDLVYEVLVTHQQLYSAVAFCARHDAHTLVINHLGKPPITGDVDALSAWRNAMTDLVAMPHVLFKISGLATEAQAAPGSAPDLDGIRLYMDTALELFGEKRLLFGSDWPVCRLATSYADWFTFIDDWARAQGTDAHRRLFGANAASIYALDN